MLGFSLAVCAGLAASLASVSSKLAFEEGGYTIRHLVCTLLYEEFCTPVVVALRIISFLLMLLCNALMWTLFVRALQDCQSTVEATVTNSAANFFFTAVFGIVLFGEVLSLLWWLGASLIVAGLVLIHQGGARDREGEKAK